MFDGRIYPRVEIHQFLFRRLIGCEACGRSLTGERQKGHVYYRCHERSCRGVSLSETGVDAVVSTELAWLTIDGEAELGDLRDLFKVEIAHERASEGDVINAIERDLGAIEQRLSRLTDAFLDQMIDKAAFEERRAELLGRKLALREKLERGEASTHWRDVAERFELGLTAHSGYISAGDERKREIVQEIGSNLIAAGKSPYFRMVFPFHEIREWAKSEAFDPTRGAVRTLELMKRLAANDNEEVRRSLPRP